MNAKNVVTASLAITGVVAVLSQIEQGKRPTIRIGIGIIVVGASLGFLSEGAPQLASGLAILIATSTVFVYGAPAVAAITNATT